MAIEMDDKGRARLTTGVVRASFVNLVTARPPMQGAGSAKFGLTCIVDPNDAGELWQAIVQVANFKFGPQGETLLRSGAIPSPLRNGAEKPDRPELVGKFFFSATNTKQPPVIASDGVTPVNPNTIYSGAFVRCMLSVFYYEVKGDKGQIMKKGISIGIEAVQFAWDGDRLDSAVSAKTAASAFAAAGALPQNPNAAAPAFGAPPMGAPMHAAPAPQFAAAPPMAAPQPVAPQPAFPQQAQGYPPGFTPAGAA